MFLVKVLNITSIDQNENMHILYKKKKSKVELHLSKNLFWWFSQNFAIFSYKMCVTFDFGQNILHFET